MKAIDIHVHGIGGYDTKGGSVEDIERISDILGSDGVAEFIISIYPGPIPEMRRAMEVVKGAMANQAARRGDKDPRASVIKGVYLEGPFLNPKKAGALDKMSFLIPNERVFMGLIEGFEAMVKIMTIAPELEGAVSLIRKMADMDIVVSMGHSAATYKEAEAGFNAGAKGITHIFNAMRGIHHRELGIAGFGLLNPHIYIEVIADPYHLDIKTIEMVFKIKNHSRIIIVSDSIKETGLKSPVVDSMGTLQGGSMTVTKAVKRLIEAGFDKDMLLRCITENPEIYISNMSN